MNAVRVLVVDGNVADMRRKQSAAVGYDAGTGYAQVLRRLAPELLCDVVYAADADRWRARWSLPGQCSKLACRCSAAAGACRSQ
jgi:hypothetical protein